MALSAEVEVTMRLVVHMGAPKTASTFLQKALSLNEDLLVSSGIYLAHAGRRSTTSNVNHHNLAWELLGDRRFRPENGSWDGLRDELDKVSADTVLVSSEAFARLASDEEKQSLFADRLAEISDDVTLVYVVRDPLSRINSMYTQSVKTFAGSGSFEWFASSAIKSGFYDLQKSFQPWYEGGRFRFVALRFDEFVEVGPLESILDVAGSELPRDKLTNPEEETNVSPGPLAVAGMRLLDARLRVLDPEFFRRSAMTTKLSMIAQRRADTLGWNDTKFWGWDRELARWAAKRLRASNHQFAQAVWGTRWPLEMPVTRERTEVALVELPGKTRNRVDAFVSFLSKRYLHMRRQTTHGEERAETGDQDDESMLDQVERDEPRPYDDDRSEDRDDRDALA